MANTENLIQDCVFLAEQLANHQQQQHQQVSTISPTASQSSSRSQPRSASRTGRKFNQVASDSGDINDHNSVVYEAEAMPDVLLMSEEGDEPEEDITEREDIILPSFDKAVIEKMIQYFRSNLHILNLFTSSINHLLIQLQPSHQELSNRHAIIDYLKSQVKLSLSCSVFITDYDLLDCFLFQNKKISLQLLIGKSYSASWDAILLEHLTYLSETCHKGSSNHHQQQQQSYRKKEDQRPTAGSSSSSVEHGMHPDSSGHVSSSSSSSQRSHSSPTAGGTASSGSLTTLLNIRNVQIHHPTNPDSLSSSSTSHQLQQLNNENDSASFPFVKDPTISCMINQYTIELGCNPTIDLAVLTLIEELCLLIGKEKLLKRSFVLISSFFFQEMNDLYSSKEIKTQQEEGLEAKQATEVTNKQEDTQVECADKNEGTKEENDVERMKQKLLQEKDRLRGFRAMISDDILWIMILSIFNKYYSIINDPLQALLLLLVEYANYDPSIHIITVYGMLEMTSSSSSRVSSSGNLSPSSVGTSPYGQYGASSEQQYHQLQQQQQQLQYPRYGTTPTAAWNTTHVSSSSSGKSIVPSKVVYISKANYLIKSSFLEKYWNMVNIEDLSSVSQSSEVFNSTLNNPNSIPLTKKFQSNMIHFPAFPVNNHCLTALHPLTHQLLQSKSVFLNTTNNQVSEIFHFGLMRFSSLLESLSASSVNQNQENQEIYQQLLMESLFPALNHKLKGLSAISREENR
jgi:hypothetical protein